MACLLNKAAGDGRIAPDKGAPLGRVIRPSGHQILVEVEGREILCLLRGRLKAGRRRETGVVVAGDWVEVQLDGDEGVISAVKPRRSWISRQASGGRDLEQVIAANLDWLCIVAAVREPVLRPGFIDRALIAAHSGNLAAILCFNKLDLDPSFEDGKVVQIYRNLGYPVFLLSAKNGHGLEELKAKLAGGVSAFVGQSGVGKSSLLNCLDPDLDIKTNLMMTRHDRGRHTTTAARLYPMAGGYLVDTPGIKELQPWGIVQNELVYHYNEMAPLEGTCRFRDCSHRHEPGCAVLEAVEEGRISRLRHQGYCSVWESL